MGPKTKSAHLLRWHYGERVTMGQFSNSFPKHFSYLCEYAFRFDLSCSYCEYPFIFHCLHCSPSCFDPDSLLLAHLWLGLSWIDYISANKSFHLQNKQQETLHQQQAAGETKTQPPAPEDGRPGGGQRLTPDAAHNGGRPTPRGRPPTTPAARRPHRTCRPRGQCWAPTTTHPRRQHVGGGPQQPAQWASSQGRDSA